MNKVMTLGIEVEVDEKGSITKLRQVDSAVEAVGKSGTSAGGAIAGFSGKLAGMATGLVGSLVAFSSVQAAFRGLTTFAGESVRQFVESEAIIKRLSTTLATVGVSYNDVSGSLRGTISEIQRLTRYGDEETMDVLQRLVQTTGDFEAAQRLLLPTLDLAAGKQMDIASAAELVGKAGAGNVEMLSRYGIILSDATKEQIKNADAMDRAAIVAGLLNDKFGGQAAATLETYGGQAKQLANYFGDLQEAVGGALLRSLGDTGESTGWLVDKMKDLTEALDDLDLSGVAASFDGLAGSIRDFVDALSGSEATQALEFLVRLGTFKLSKDLEMAAQVFKSFTWGGVVPDIDSLEEAGRAIEEQARIMEQIKEHQQAIAEHQGDASRVLGAQAIASHSAEIDTLAGRYTRLEKALRDYAEGVWDAGRANKAAGDSAAEAGRKTVGAWEPTKDQLKALEDLEKKVAEARRDHYLALAEETEWQIKNREAIEETLTVADEEYEQLVANAETLIKLGKGYENAAIQGDALSLAQGSVYGTTGDVTLNVREGTKALEAYERGLQDTSHYADLFADSMRELIFTGMRSIFEGDDLGEVIESVFESLGELGANSFANAFMKALSGEGSFIENLTGGQWRPDRFGVGGEWAPNSGAQRIGMGLQGAGMVYSGYQQGGAGGALQGMMGGFMAGLALGNPITGVIGAVIGGLAAYFGGGGEHPESIVSVHEGGRTNVSTRGGQGVSPEEAEAWEREISNLYRQMFLGFRAALREFRDAALFDLVGEMPDFEGQSWLDMTIGELGKWLGEVKLPDLFQSQFGEAITTGLENLGMTGDAIEEFWREIGELGGDERLDAMTRFISTLRTINDLIEDSAWESLWEEARTDVVTGFIQQLSEVGDQLDLLSAGWENMDLLSRAAEVEQIGDLFESALDGVIQMLQTIDAMRVNISASWDAFRESMTLADLEGNTEGLRQYYQDQIDYWMQQLGEADTLEELQTAQDNLMRYMNALAGVVPLTEPMDVMGWGQTWGEYLSEIADEIEALAQARLDEIEDTVQAAWDALVTNLYTARDALTDFADMLDGITGGGDPGDPGDEPVEHGGPGKGFYIEEGGSGRIPGVYEPEITIVVNNYAPGIETYVDAMIDQKMQAVYSWLQRRSTLPIE